MSEKMFSDPFSTCQRPPCAKQSDQNTYFSYGQVNNSFLQSNNALYSGSTSQNCLRTQNMNLNPSYADTNDVSSWENRLIPDVERNIKIPEKIDLIEISSKDLSPASFCSNIDLMLPDFYKSTPKDNTCYNKYDNQWYYNTNYNSKSYEYPSCAQVNQNTVLPNEKTTKYCSIQRNQEFDSISSKNCSYQADLSYTESDVYFKGHKNCLPNEVISDYNTYNYYENKFPECNVDTNCSNAFFIENQNIINSITYPPLSTIDQQTDGSNDESDIIVEESDEETVDYNDFQEKELYYQMNKCVICNVMFTPVGSQFYFLTNETPLTMSSQKPVFSKLVSIVGNISSPCKYLCSECLGLVNTIDHLQMKLESFQTELLTKFKNTCKENNVEFKQNLKLRKNHIRRYFINKWPKHRCKLCKKILCLKKYCQYHLKKHKVTGFLCELCGKICKKRRSFQIHMKSHKRKTEPIKILSFKCSNCSRCFRTKSNLKEHENYCLGTLPYQCKNQYCDKKFASATKLKNHVKLKHEKKFIAICSICNIGFVKVSDYKSHMITHSTDKKYSCTKCEKSYKTLGNLNFHMKVHIKKLPFICDICEKGFMRKEYLEAHINNHKGIKNFCCTICDKKFVSQKNLDSHLKYHEGSVKKNTCNICGKTMTSGFEDHLRIHNNLREFECDNCDLRFNTKSAFAKHKKKKHASYVDNEK